MSNFVDLSRLSPPAAIESTNVEEILAAYKVSFLEAWNRAREIDPTLPAYTTLDIETDPAAIALQAIAYGRFLDRVRVNDAVNAVLAMLAKGSNLDHVAARQGVKRAIVVPADEQSGTPAVLQSDEAFLRAYLLSFERPSAGSVNRYLFEALQAFPGAGDVAVVGRAIHGRRGEVDIVVSGPNGRDATDEEMKAVRDRVLADDVAPEAVAISVRRADRVLYQVDLVILVPPGPDKGVVAREAALKVKAATDERTKVGGEVPLDFITGAAYVANVIKVFPSAPAISIEAAPYAVPVCESIRVRAEVAS